MKNFQTVCAVLSLASLSGKICGWPAVLFKNPSEDYFAIYFQISPGSADRLFPLKPKNPI